MLEGKSGDDKRRKYWEQSQIDAKDRAQYPPRIVSFGVIYNCCHAPIFADAKDSPSPPGAPGVTYLGHDLEAKGP